MNQVISKQGAINKVHCTELIKLKIPAKIKLYKIILSEIVQWSAGDGFVKGSGFEAEFEAVTESAAGFDEAGDD